MSFEYLRKPLPSQLTELSQNVSDQKKWQQTKSWPCTVTKVEGSIVTVQFEVTSPWQLIERRMPLFGPEYIRYPIKAGCKGYAMAADTTLGQMSGLGPNIPPALDQPPNLTALVFMPIGNLSWEPPMDANCVCIYADNGVDLYTTDKKSVVQVNENTITISWNSGADTIVLNSSGITLNSNTAITVSANSSITLSSPSIILDGAVQQGAGSHGGNMTMAGNMTITGTLTAGGIDMNTHIHNDPQGGVVGPPHN